ncbi:MAG TPA: hypothetical protein VMR62_11060 [Bryobacteraceae bacterium]|jgi:hypothetical protein|nr:hypothetical protein [Bryobacteraceae bacterium]
MAAAIFNSLDSGVQVAAKQKLAAIVEKSVAPGQVPRLMVYCRLLPQIGRADALADIASIYAATLDLLPPSGPAIAVDSLGQVWATGAVCTTAAMQPQDTWVVP